MLRHGAQALADANAANRKTLLALGMFSQGVLTCSFAAANAFVRAPMRTSQSLLIIQNHGNILKPFVFTSKGFMFSARGCASTKLI